MKMATTNGNVPKFESKVTVYVSFCWVLAAFGGLMFGYDIGISGTRHVFFYVFLFLHILCFSSNPSIGTIELVLTQMD